MSGFGRREAALVNQAALGAALAVQVLVAAGVVPAAWVAGGRIADPRAGRWTSVVSAGVLLPLLVASSRPDAVPRPVFGAMAALFAASVPAQLLGTPFERRVMSGVAAAIAVSSARLAWWSGASLEGPARGQRGRCSVG